MPTTSREEAPRLRRTDGDADYVIDVEGLTKSFSGRTVVRDLSMRVRRGQIYGFLGPNGSGKTTTIRMLCGLLTPDAGRGRCLGFDIIRESERIKPHVGYMTQRFSLYQDLSIRENLEFLDAKLSGRTPLTRLKADGGWYAVLRAPASVSDEERALDLLDRAGVHVHPGELFGFDRPGHLVVSLITPHDLFREGIGRIVETVE